MIDILSKLEIYGAQIGRDSQGLGVKAEAARNVMTYYNMWQRCPGDTMSRALCEEALTLWLALKAE